MTPVRDTEVEIVFRIAVRGRAGALSEFLEAVNKAHGVVLWVIGEPVMPEEQGQGNVITAAGGRSG